MRSKIVRLLVLGGLFFMMSCNNGKSEVKEESDTTQNMAAPKLDIMLVDNKPWEANAETTAGIISMQQHLQVYKKNPDSYLELKQRLENEFSLLVEKCTMKGESHEQLHNYLIPITVYFEELGDPDKETAQAGFEKLEQHLGVYSVYFK